MSLIAQGRKVKIGNMEAYVNSASATIEEICASYTLTGASQSLLSASSNPGAYLKLSQDPGSNARHVDLYGNDVQIATESHMLLMGTNLDGQAAMDGFEVKKMKTAIGNADIIVTATGNKDILTEEYFRLMKDKAIVCNIGHFDNEIDVAYLENTNSIKEFNIKPQVDRFEFSDGHSIILLSRGRLVNLGNATGHSSFVMSTSFTNQVLAQMALWNREIQDGVHVLSKELDEEVARLHLSHLGVDLTVLTDEQADYIGTPKNGPYKPNGYRY